MSVKIISVWSALTLAALALTLSGCSPSGPEALLKGKKLLDRGDYSGAATYFQTATALLATNAAAWNYYGVALQGAGQLDDAVGAYQRALALDRDLLEARLNLGALFLEQGKPADAKGEFTAYTLRRPNDPEGWLKLGSAQLRLEQTIPAERSFSSVLALKTNEAQAYNGLGLARIQRNRPQEAAQFFAAALQRQPEFAPALLNLATVYDQYLHDRPAALKNYRNYLTLVPKPANWETVNALVNNLEQTTPVALVATAAPAPAPAPAAAVAPAPTRAAPVVATPPPRPVASSPAPAARPNPPVTATVAAEERRPATRVTTPEPPRTLQSPRAQAAGRAGAAGTTAERTAPAAPVQVVQVAPEPRIVTSPNAATPPSTATPVRAPVSKPEPKPGLFGRVFGSTKTDEEEARSKYLASGVTPLPDTTAVAARPVMMIAPAPVNLPRYNYLSPARPQAGDRREADGAFTLARMAEQNENWDAALGNYRQAAAQDPSWFEAHYNAGVIAQRLQNYNSALASYETALAIQPDSTEARYYFALTLKAAGYAPDAANELKKILAADPDNVRAHLALANLCAQTLHDPAQARQHYLKVLELDPKNSRTSDIRFWLTANPG